MIIVIAALHALGPDLLQVAAAAADVDVARRAHLVDRVCDTLDMGSLHRAPLGTSAYHPAARSSAVLGTADSHCAALRPWFRAQEGCSGKKEHRSACSLSSCLAQRWDRGRRTQHCAQQGATLISWTVTQPRAIAAQAMPYRNLPVSMKWINDFTRPSVCPAISPEQVEEQTVSNASEGTGHRHGTRSAKGHDNVARQACQSMCTEAQTTSSSAEEREHGLTHRRGI